MSIVARADHYWFAPARLRDLAYLRIGIVLVLLLGVLWPGALDEQLRSAALPAEWFLSLPTLKVLLLPLGWGARPGPAALTAVWIVCGTAGLLALAGAHTRASLATFAFTSTILIINQYTYGTVHHPEAAAVIMMWVLLFTPCGAALSVDDMRARVAANLEREEFVPRGADEVSRDARWPMRLAQWLLVLVYLSAGLSKLVVGGPAWLNGYTMSYYFLLDGVDHRLPFTMSLAHLTWFGTLCAAGAVAFELTFVLCVIFPRLSAPYLAAGTALHTGIWLLMRPGFFQFMALYAAFAEPLRAEWRRVRGSAREDRVWTLVYDGYCPLCIRTMTQLDALDGARRLRYVDLERDTARAQALLPGVSIADLRTEMAVVTPSGAVLRGFFAFRDIALRLPALWPLVPFMFAFGGAWTGTRVYAWVAAHRPRRLCDNAGCAVHDVELLD